MTHPIISLQGALVAALRGDAALAALVGADGVFDAPPIGRAGAHVTIARHDLLPRDGDAAPGYEHRVLIHVWPDAPSRKAALLVADRIAAVALGAALDGTDLVVTNRVVERTDTAMDAASGQARAALTLRFFTEPAG
jgi:hypothetical protein